VASISEMAAKGQAKLARKATQMATSYDAAKGRMVEGFRGVGFGPARTAAYQAGVSAATYHAPDPAKWARNWSAKMAE
jgi:hypothetical protein